MIITHSIKITNPRAKSAGVISLRQSVNGFLSNADAIRYSKQFWAAPTNAADMPAAKLAAEAANKSRKAVEECFPPSLSYADKQLFMKTERGYVLHTPAIGCALLHAMNALLKADISAATAINHQPIPAAWANHGEVMLANHGKLRAVSIGNNQTKGFNANYKHTDSEGKMTGIFLVIEGVVQGFNANSGLIAVGVPSITAIHGLIDSWAMGIESSLIKSIKSIKFAFGIKKESWSSASIKGTNNTPDVKSKADMPMIAYSEKKGDCEFRIILSANSMWDTSAEKALLEKIQEHAVSGSWRLAGGTVFDLAVKKATEISPDGFAYLKAGQYSIDPIQEAVQAAKNRESFPIMVGYRLLEEPKLKTGLRDGKTPHAFSEALYLPCTFSRSPAFWSYCFTNDIGVCS